MAKFDALIGPFMSACSRRASTVTIQLEGTSAADGADYGSGGEEAEPAVTVEGLVTEAELNAQQERTWRQLRIAELLKRYSSDSDLIVV